MKNQIVDTIKVLYEKGFMHIFSSGLINKIMGFVGNVIVVRNLTKGQYGAFGYADSIMAFAIIFCGFGISSGILQFCSEKRPEQEKNAFTIFGLKYGVLASILVSLTCILYAKLGHFEIEESKNILLFYALYPITFFLFDFFIIFFRTKKDNKRYALIRNINSITYVFLAATLTYFLDEYGILIGLYVSTIVSSSIGFYYIRTEDVRKYDYKLNKANKISIIKFSTLSFTARIMSDMLIFLDVFLIGTMIGNPEVLALYKIATVIPLALMIVPDSIIMFVYPYVAENKDNFQWLKDNFNKLFKISFIINGAITIILILSAPLIIYTLWGPKYMEAITAFRLLSLNYFFSATFRFNLINLLTAMYKIKKVFAVNLISSIVNILLDIIFIENFGAIGAAYATIIVVILSSLLLAYVMIKDINRIRFGQS